MEEKKAHPFDELCRQYREGSLSQEQRGIGTLGEHTLHALLKEYFQPNPAFREVPLDGFVADILCERGIVEIQTRQLSRLTKKLEAWLPRYPVTVVYPVAAVKWLSWVDLQTGEVSGRRKSPKKGAAYDIFAELYWMRKMLPKERLSFQVVLLEIGEYRLLDGWSRDKKRGSQRMERIPLSWCGEVLLQSAEDFRNLLPPLPERFTVKELAKLLARSPNFAQRTVSLLREMGVLAQVGRQGRSYVYALT